MTSVQSGTLEPITIIEKHQQRRCNIWRYQASQCSGARDKATNGRFDELDRVRAAVGTRKCKLICGEPGIGKSTLVLQSSLACANSNKKTLYFTVEESALQIKDRAQRLSKELPDNIYISATTDMEAIISMIEKEKPDVIILDSIQMVMSQKLTSMPVHLIKSGFVHPCLLMPLNLWAPLALWLATSPKMDNWLAQKC